MDWEWNGNGNVSKIWDGFGFIFQAGSMHLRRWWLKTLVLTGIVWLALATYWYMGQLA
jgi:hypothetical protein